jgi:hypothetical protein
MRQTGFTNGYAVLTIPSNIHGAQRTCLWGSRGMSRPCSALDMKYLLLKPWPRPMPRPLLLDLAAAVPHDVLGTLLTSPSRRTRPRLLFCISGFEASRRHLPHKLKGDHERTSFKQKL